MAGSAVVKIVVVLLILVIRFVIKQAKSNSTTGTVSKATPPPFTGTSQSQSFQNPFAQQNTSNPTTFTKTNTSDPNPFQQTPPAFNNPFMDTPDAFSQPSQQNVNSNMGSGSQNFYCMYCGKKFQSTAALLKDTCFKHPKADISLQKHVLYQGAGRPNIGF